MNKTAFKMVSCVAALAFAGTVTACGTTKTEHKATDQTTVTSQATETAQEAKPLSYQDIHQALDGKKMGGGSLVIEKIGGEIKEELLTMSKKGDQIGKNTEPKECGKMISSQLSALGKDPSVFDHIAVGKWSKAGKVGAILSFNLKPNDEVIKNIHTLPDQVEKCKTIKVNVNGKHAQINFTNVEGISNPAFKELQVMQTNNGEKGTSMFQAQAVTKAGQVIVYQAPNKDDLASLIDETVKQLKL